MENVKLTPLTNAKADMVEDFIINEWKPQMEKLRLTQGLKTGMDLRLRKLNTMIWDDDYFESDVQDEIDEIKNSIKRVSIFKKPKLKRKIFKNRP